MTRSSALHVCAAIGCLSVVAGCSTNTVVVPPTELTQARVEYESASRGATAQFAPAELQDAHGAIDRADRVLHADPGSPASRATAYVALRRVQTAESAARTRMASVQAQSGVFAIVQAQSQRLATTQGDLQSARDDLTRLQCAGGLSASDGSCAAQVRDGALVIPGAALFDVGRSELTPAARANLDAVAQALKTDRRRVRIEGFTDSTGTAAANQALSDARAVAVCRYLTSAGVDPSRIRTEGLGEKQPIAGNDTPGGRAANRRATIVVEPSGVVERQR